MDLMHKIVSGETRTAVGHHTGLHQYLDDHLTSEEKIIIGPLSPRKRTEWLASRELLFQLSNLPSRQGCVYDEFGKPELKGSDHHISISHSERWCAAMISDLPCGVDIQIYNDTVVRIADRFLHDEEAGILARHPHRKQLLHVLWGAKECLYKAYGKKKLEFKQHIRIEIPELTSGQVRGEIRYEGLHLQYDIHFRMLPETVWVYCTQRPFH